MNHSAMPSRKGQPFFSSMLAWTANLPKHWPCLRSFEYMDGQVLRNAFAVLLAEGLVKKVGTEKDSGYVIGDIGAFKQAMSALVASDTDLSTPVDIPVSASTKPKRNAKGAA